MQVLAQLCLGCADLDAAVQAPRLHVRFGESGRPLVEHEASDELSAAIARAGVHGLDHGELSMYFGGVGAAYRDSDGQLRAAGDPRREAAVGVS
jgi:gamma-glutamyltranspeptidase/glutathione hydrolase